MFIKVFKLLDYNSKQITSALTCPINRNATMEKHGCDEEYLHKNPHLLIIHFKENGGAEEFDKRCRKKFWRKIEVPEYVPEDYQI